MDELIAIGLDLSMASMDALELYIDQSEDPDFYMEIFNACKQRPEVLKMLVEHEKTPVEARMLAAKELNVDLAAVRAAQQPKKQMAEEEKQESLMKQISRLSISEKIRLAQKGGSQARGVLAREANKLVVMAVLNNPKITDSEVDAIARNRSVVEDALRAIAKNKEWMKNYSVKMSIIGNPKTPVALSMPLIPTLKKKDLSQLEKNKNVPEAVRTTAKRLVKGAKE